MPLRTQTLVLNSRDRDNASQPTNNYTITLNTPVFNVVKADLRYFYMSNGMFNIDTGNNTFNISVATTPTATTATVIISPGFYTETDLTQAVMNSAPNVFNLPTAGVPGCAIDNSTNQLRIGWLSAVNNFVKTITFPNASTSQTFGFGGALTNTMPASAVQIAQLSPFEVQISLDPYVFLQSSKLQNQLTTSTGFSAFAVVPATSMPSNIAAGESSLGFTYDGSNSALDSAYFTNPITLDMIDIRIVDSRGVLVNVRQNNSTIILTVVVSV